MKYNPELIKKYPEVFKDLKTLGKYLALIKFKPSNTEESYYYCTIYGRHFKTDSGAGLHIDVKHEKEILEIIG